MRTNRAYTIRHKDPDLEVTHFVSCDMGGDAIRVSLHAEFRDGPARIMRIHMNCAEARRLAGQLHRMIEMAEPEDDEAFNCEDQD